jgi:uncharacterized protein (DUF2336 family)
MSEHASWQGQSPQPAGAQMIDASVTAQGNPVRSVNAESFKSLLTRLKSGPIQQSLSAAPKPVVPAQAPVVAETFIVPQPVAPPVVVAEMPAIPAPPPLVVPPVVQPAPVPATVAAPTVTAAPPIMPAPFIPPTPSVAMPPIMAAPEMPVQRMAPTPPPPIIPAPQPAIAPEPMLAAEPSPASAPPPATTVQQQRRPLVDPELEMVMRLVAALASSEERHEFIQEAAALALAEKINQQPEGELAALEEQFAQQDEISEGTEAQFVEAKIAEKIAIAISPDASEDAAAARLASMDEVEAGELARTLLDMMASSSNTGLPHERALAADTLLRLVPRLPLKPLVLLADRLSIMEAPPHLLIAKLIRDPRIEVSGPLLENSPHITENDLVFAIEEGIAAKRRLIARRRRVSREISDRLIATNDPSVLLTLVRNAAAEISHDGFLKLSAAAGAANELLAPLCTRVDLPAPFAFELFWVAPVQLRRYLLNRFLTDSETLTKILKITLATQGGEDASSSSFPAAEDVAAAIGCFISGDNQAGCEKLSILTKVNQATIARIFSDELGESVAILLKALGCQRQDFTGHMEALRASEHAALSPAANIDDLQSLFDQMSFNKARILLTYWDWAVLKTGPYAPLN